MKSSTISFLSTDSTLMKKMKNDSSTQPNSNSCDEIPKFKKILSSEKISEYERALKTCQKLQQKYGIHSVMNMKAAGFSYTSIGDAARCDKCELEVSGWTINMKPFTIHSERSPNCTFVRAFQSSSTSSRSTTSDRTTSESHESEIPPKRQKIEATNDKSHSYAFSELDTLKRVRRRTFSHWPHRNSPSRAQMIEAGFFHCNVGDRVICLYCNLICQQWTPNVDDPCEVHKTLSPQCSYVLAMLARHESTSVVIVNENVAGNRSTAAVTSDTFRSREIVLTAACNVGYIEIPKRHASFANWPKEPLPSVDDLVRAGFFYTGTKTIVTCFYCNGSLQSWGPNDNPTIEHARWFPHCLYAKQLCGDDLYRKIQESKRAQQERARAADPTSNVTSNSQKLQIADESTLSRLVAARLDLPISQRLLNQNFKLSIIKRCWEDQLRLKLDDFETDCDLLIACTILQKQIDHINGKKENIIVPSVQIQKIRERKQAAHASPSSIPPTASLSTNPSNASDVDMTEPSQSSTTVPNPRPVAITEKTKIANISTTSATSKPIQKANATLANPCAICFSEEKRLACIPCGHLATCVPCGHSLRSCPMCRREIEAFVRIYL